MHILMNKHIGNVLSFFAERSKGAEEDGTTDLEKRRAFSDGGLETSKGRTLTFGVN